MSATIRDVARLAGVGSATVSRVLNDSPRVTTATRARVLAAIAELEYVPSAVARHLSTGRTGAIGVVVPFLTRPSVVERLRGAAAALAGTSFDLVAFDIESLERRTAVLDRVTRGGRVEGLIFVSIWPRPDEFDRLLRSGIPTVLVDAHHQQFSRVVVDDVAGGRAAARHLLELGHDRIAFVGDDPRSRFRFSASRLRRWGVGRAMRSAGAVLDPAFVRMGGSLEATRGIAEELLRLRPRPTAIVCGSDTEALGVLEAARRLGISVPDGLSVVGYDDIEVASHVGLTTIRQPLHESGVRGVELLLGELSGVERPPFRLVLPTELVVRSTTAPPPA